MTDQTGVAAISALTSCTISADGRYLAALRSRMRNAATEIVARCALQASGSAQDIRDRYLTRAKAKGSISLN